MRRLFKYLGLALLAFLLVLTVLLGFGFDRLIDGQLRPWAATKVAATLNGEVDIDRLELGWGRLELTGVVVARPGEFRLRMETIAVRYTITDLWRRQLASVIVRQPDLEWEAAGAAAAEPVAWPVQPPLWVAEWRVEDGRLLLQAGENRLLLRHFEAQGTLANRFATEISAVLGSEPGVPLALTGHGQWEGRPELTITELRLSGHALLQEPVTVAPGVESFSLALALEQLDDVEATRILAALDRQPPWPPELGWQVTTPRLNFGMEGERLSLRLETAAGEVRRQGERWLWESLRLQVAEADGSWSVEGEVAMPAQARFHLTGAWSEERFKGVWRFTAPSPVQLGKAYGFDLPTPAERLLELTLAGELQAAAEAVVFSRVRASARLQGGYELAGALSGRWQEGAVSVEVTDLALRQGASRLAMASLKLAQRPKSADWQGNWRLQVPDARGLTQVLAVAVPADWPSLQNLELQGELATVAGRLLLPAVQMTGRLTRTDLDGRVSGRLSARQLADGWRFEVTQLALTELEYMSPDGLSGLTGGALRLAGNLALQEHLSFDLHGEAAADEALSGSWYADLGGLPLGLVLTGVWEPATGRVQLRTGRLDLAELITTRLQGSLAGERLELSGEVAAPRLDGPFQLRLRQLVAGVAPGFERLELAGGLTAQASGSWSPDGWNLEASVRPAGVTLARGEAMRLTGLSGELTLLLARGASVPGGERFSTLQWDELRAGPIVSAGGGLRLATGTNRWRLAEPLLLAAAGGRLEVVSFTLALPATGPEAQASLRATGVELAEMSRVLDWPEMGGQLGAELPDIRFADEEISTVGEARLQVFNGEVRLRNMRVRKPFSPYPAYHADIDFSGIDLQLLTQAFDFGEINGVADGFVHDLRLFGAVPSAFNAEFETRQKGKRNISVKAIRNLNTLSQGGLSAALSHGIYRFIDYYRYRKIGIRCSLHNDVFHLTGTARPGMDTYLIYGGWLPPRLDVVVSTPTISFQEMVRRLKRIDRAGR
jgi:translocation and assembly module TamB